MGMVTIRADIGQKRDPSAIAVADATWRVTDGQVEDYYQIRFLERLPLGTDYPAVAARIASVASNAQRHGGHVARLNVDVTGVGRPVSDMIPPLLARLGVGAPVWAVSFTFGDRLTERADDREATLGKAWLVSRLQVLLQGKRLLLPDTAEARALAAELLVYEIRVNDNGNEQFGAFKVGTHDDLVTALGLTVMTTPPRPVTPLRVVVEPPHPAIAAAFERYRSYS